MLGNTLSRNATCSFLATDQLVRHVFLFLDDLKENHDLVLVGYLEVMVV